MDSYIVRIYRRDSAAEPRRRAHDALLLAGIVEDPITGASAGFQDIESLWAIFGGNAPLATAGGTSKEEEA